MMPHTCSMGFKSGEFGGHPGNTHMWLLFIQSIDCRDVWHGAPSCISVLFDAPYLRSISPNMSDFFKICVYSVELTPDEHNISGVRCPSPMPAQTITDRGNLTRFSKQDSSICPRLIRRQWLSHPIWNLLSSVKTMLGISSGCDNTHWQNSRRTRT